MGGWEETTYRHALQTVLPEDALGGVKVQPDEEERGCLFVFGEEGGWVGG